MQTQIMLVAIQKRNQVYGNQFKPVSEFDFLDHFTGTAGNTTAPAYKYIEAKKGEYIYFESMFLNKLYFVKEGFIKTGYIDDMGNEIVKDIIQKGEIFGQFTLDYHCMNGEFAQAHHSKVSICAISIDDFQRMLVNNSQMAIAFGKQVTSKLRKIENRLFSIIHYDVKARLLCFLKELIQSNKECICGNSFAMDNFLTHDDIGGLIGCSRQTVTMVISKLETDGYLTISRKKIFIRDIAGVDPAIVV